MMRERDGDLDLGVRTLARRERFLAELDADAVHARRPIDLESFQAQWHRPHQPAEDPRAPRMASGLLREIPEFTRLAGSDAAVLRRVRDALPVPDSVSWLGEEATA